MSMYFNFNEDNEFFLSLSPEKAPRFGFPMVSVCFGASEEAVLSQPAFPASERLKTAERSSAQNGFSTRYTAESRQVEIGADIRLFGDTARQTDTVKNFGDKPVVLTENAVRINGVCHDEGGIADRLSDGSILIYICFNKSQGEGQWRCCTPEDLGLYWASCHPWEKSVFRIDSISSYSTGAYYPLVIIEDKKRGECWYVEVEGGNSWFIEIWLYGGKTARFLSATAGGADEKLGFCAKLEKGESHTSAPVAFGLVYGGFEQAVRSLTQYKRATCSYKTPAPLVFNDYMNCNWALQNDARLTGLIERAAQLGCEVFCLDDGWMQAQGIWTPADEKFTNGLQGIFDLISSKGMKIGCWFEFETAPVALKEIYGEEIFLKRNGETVAPRRPLGNFRSPKFLGYLYESVDRLYKMGVRYIKNDHNNGEDIGTDMYGESPAEGLENNARAFIAFIESLKAKYPDLVLENCGGGAKRSDWGTLSRFILQSTSDQEDYICYPSIVAGSLALMPPERAGIWCYPYPLYFGERERCEVSEKTRRECMDGEQTAFNVISSFLGAMYLSGRIDNMDENNFALLKAGVELYKEEREFISKAYPVFPLGMARMSYRGCFALGLVNEEGSRMLLAVWNLSDGPLEASMEIAGQMNASEEIYPLSLGTIKHALHGSCFKVNFKKGRCARLYRLERKN